jgi:hypothetical protein
MANIYTASCECGFQRSVRTGGKRETFQTESYFPFYCKHCGLINVNVAVPHDSCPNCDSSEIKPYGTPTTSLENRFKMVSCDKYSAPNVGNLCPKCAEFTLNFQLQMIVG